MSYVRAFFRFWYEFIIGDDWRIAAGVTAVLAGGAVGVAVGLGPTLVTTVLLASLVVVFVAPMLVDRDRG